VALALPRDPDPDKETIARAAAGDPRAFEVIVRRFERPVYALAHRLTGDADLARDVCQEVFLRLYRNLDRYDPSRPFAPWFLKLATNFALNAREHARIRRAAPLPGLPADPTADAASDLAAREEARAAVRHAVAALDVRYAGVVALFYLSGLTVSEIASRLDLPAGTVKIRLHRAREILKKELARFGGHPRG
jgi:RNA polymerase sigma-70 factor (ECF subfamily)